MNARPLVYFVITIFMAFTTHRAAAQGMAVNTDGSAAHTSAMLDVSSTTQGVLIPRMTSTQRGLISSPATGLLVYQTDAPAGFYFYNAGWSILGGGAPSGTAGGNLGGTYPNPTITSLPTISGANLTSLNGSNISSGAVGAGVGGTGQTAYTTGDILYASSATALSKLNAGTAGRVLTANGAGTAPSWQAAAGGGFVMNGVATPGSYAVTTTYFLATGRLPVSGTSGITLAQAGTPISVACILDAITIYGTTTYAGSGNTTYTLTIYKNGSATTMTISLTFSGAVGTTIAATSTTSNPVTFNVGDVIALGVTDPNTSGTGGDIHFSLHFH